MTAPTEDRDERSSDDVQGNAPDPGDSPLPNPDSGIGIAGSEPSSFEPEEDAAPPGPVEPNAS